MQQVTHLRAGQVRHRPPAAVAVADRSRKVVSAPALAPIGPALWLRQAARTCLAGREGFANIAAQSDELGEPDLDAVQRGL